MNNLIYWFALYFLISLLAAYGFFMGVFYARRNLKGEALFEDYLDELVDGLDFLDNKHPLDVEIKSMDNLLLKGIYLANPVKRATVIMMHGFLGVGRTAFATQYKYYYEHGFNILIITQRGHNESAGNFITFGVKERYDCLQWINYIVSLHPTKPILLSGISMGCATVLMTLGLAIPTNVKGVIADCGFTSPIKIIRIFFDRQYFILKLFPVMPLLKFFTNIIGKFDLESCSVEEVLKTNTVPIQFFHGQKDKVVPIEMTLANYQCAIGSKQLFLSPNSPHAMVSYVDKQSYFKHLGEFLKSINLIDYL